MVKVINYGRLKNNQKASLQQTRIQTKLKMIALRPDFNAKDLFQHLTRTHKSSSPFSQSSGANRKEIEDGLGGLQELIICFQGIGAASRKGGIPSKRLARDNHWRKESEGI